MSIIRGNDKHWRDMKNQPIEIRISEEGRLTIQSGRQESGLTQCNLEGNKERKQRKYRNKKITRGTELCSGRCQGQFNLAR